MICDQFISSVYWEQRYENGGNSGAGSYGHLAKFKADVINSFIKENEINTIIDYGVGDGNQLKFINLKNITYYGIDVSKTIIDRNKSNNKLDNVHFIHYVDVCFNNLEGDLVLSLDVIYHLIEEDVYCNYMHNLFLMSKKYVIIYAKDIEKNHANHVRFRNFTKYIDEHFTQWKLIKFIPNKFPQKILGMQNNVTSPSDFYIYKNN